MEYYCISLANRTDRRERTEKTFNQLKIPIRWWIVHKDPVGMNGCFKSHLTLWKKFRDSSSEEFLFMFEDDIELIGDWETAVSDILTKKVEAPIINLSPWILYSEHESDGWLKGKFINLSAYVIPRKYINQVIDHVEKYYGSSLDFSTLDIPMIAKPVFQQYESSSDISKYSFRSLKPVFKIPGVGKFVSYTILWNRSNPLLFKNTPIVQN